MKHLSGALLLIAAAASASAAQAQSKRSTSQGVKTAVVEFTPAEDAAAMTPNSKRWLQAQLSARLNHTRRFDVYDTRHTRDASQASLTAINHDSSTTPAVHLGRKLGVSWVLTGRVTRWIPRGDDGFGHATLRTRLVDVATGRVLHAGETVQKGWDAMNGTGEAEVHAKVMKPAIDSLIATLVAAIPATP